MYYGWLIQTLTTIGQEHFLRIYNGWLRASVNYCMLPISYSPFSNYPARVCAGGVKRLLLSVCQSVCPWQNSAVGISEQLNNFYTWQKRIASVDFSMCVLDKLNSPVCRRTRLEKSLAWMPFSAVRSLVPRLLLLTWPYRGIGIGLPLRCSRC